MTLTPRPSRMKAARVLLGVAAASSLLLVTACGGSDADAGTEGADYGTVDVNLSWIKNAEFAGLYFADANGYYEEAGFSEVNLIAGGPSGTSTEAMVLSGGALVGTSSPVGVAPVIVEEDAPLKIIGTTYQKNPFAIISLDAAIAAPEDLVGRKIGVQAGVNETLFDALLEVNGIDAASVEKVPVQYDPQPLVNGEVDGFFGYLTNEALTLELAGQPPTLLPFADHGLPFIAESFVTTDEAIETRREELKAFLEASLRGWKDAVDDAEESARLAVEEYGADLNLDMAKEIRQAEEQNTKLVVTEETEANGLFTVSEELMQQNIDILKLAGFDLTAEQVFDMSLLAEVLEENPELK
ncbi:NMT1/THI5 like protein [Arthrobacter saudimassiliensis]|uniref:Thiamine pyrimidine synthase n=1 Tax=Arthrobacter saudimassiliensis TaxID=1461584 RepID=A0A078MI26_9MICC|nr:NMT1/THI5 like protein [Arthrobacter saudimassiliensis]